MIFLTPSLLVCIALTCNFGGLTATDSKYHDPENPTDFSEDYPDVGIYKPSSQLEESIERIYYVVLHHPLDHFVLKAAARPYKSIIHSTDCSFGSLV